MEKKIKITSLTILAVLVLLGVIGIVAYFSRPSIEQSLTTLNPAADENSKNLKELNGSIVYLERVALPEGSLIEVKLQDISRADAPATEIATTTITTKGENVPVPFDLSYDTSKIDERFDYAISARITIDDELRWINTSRIPVLTKGNPTSGVEVLVSMVTSNENLSANEASLSNSILNKEWVWQYTEAVGGTRIMPSDPQNFILQFREDKTFTSSTDCNTLRGHYVLDGEILSVGPIASTKMFCGSEALENEYYQELSRATSYKIQDNDLRINLLKDAGTMVFSSKSKSETPLKDLSFRLTSYNGSIIPEDQNYTLEFKNDSLYAKFCNGMNGSYSQEENSLKANLMTTFMYCAEPSNLMEMEGAFGSLLREGVNFSFEEENLILNGKNQTMIFSPQKN